MYVSDSEHVSILRLKVMSDIDAAINSIARLEDGLGGFDKAADKAQRIMVGVKGAIDGTGASASAATGKVKKYAEGFDLLVKEMNKFKKAEREAAQLNVVSGSLDGKNQAELSQLSTAELKSYIAIDDARGQNAVAVARQIVASREREAKQAEASAKVVVAAQERESAAYSANYSAQVAAADKIDQQIASSQASSRYATPNKAARNTANPGNKADAQAGYANQATKEYSASLRANADAHNKVFDAAHGEALAINNAMNATKAGTAANSDHSASLIATRYALYDVATTYGAISAALLAVSALTVKTGADFESAFSGVERTTLDASGNAAAGIKGIEKSLIDLSTQIPVSFDEIARIATIGAQMGVAAGDLAAFAETTAKFAALTGMTADASAAALGTIGQLTGVAAKDYDRLASSIALVGVNAQATEADIVATAQKISGLAADSGFSAEQIIGLSGALASLKIAPERAQGVLSTYFSTLNKAVAEGGDKLANFGIIAGISAEETAKLVRENPEEFFRKFTTGLSSLDPVTLTTSLDVLGLGAIRASEVFTRLSGHMDLYNSTQADAAKGSAENVALNQQYAKVVEDLNSQMTLLWQSIQAFAAGGTSELIPGLAGAVGGLKDLINGVKDLTASGFGQVVGRYALILTTLVGAFFAYRAAMALATASTYALTTAQIALSSQGTTNGIRGLMSAILGLNKATVTAGVEARVTAGSNKVLAASGEAVGAGATVAATGATRFASALKAVGRATVIIAVIQLLSELVFNFNGTMRSVADGLAWVGDVIAPVLNFIADGIGNISKALGPLGGSLSWLSGALRDSAKAGQENIKSVQKWANALPTDKVDDLTAATDDTSAALDAIDAGSIDEVGVAATAAAARVYTLANYASDLGGVIQRAFDIRFAGGQGADSITSGWSAIAKATADANKAIRDYRTTIQQLNADNAQLGADRGVLEYFAAVAAKYGDGLATADLQARLAKNAADQAAKQNELTDANKSLTDAQAANSKGLTGSSDAAVANRAQILGLVTSYQDYIGKLAASGMSQADLAATSVRLKAEFQAQATQAGYSAAEIDTYSAAFDSMKVAIDNVPRNITVDANTDPAMQALAEFLAAAASSSADVPITSSGAGAAGAAAGAEAASAFSDVFNRALLGQSNGTAGKGLGFMLNPRGGTVGFGGGGGGGGGFADGGYTGDGGMYQPAGIVHKGEYVFSKAATQNLGVDKLARLHSVGRGSRGYANGGLVGGSSGGSGFGGPTDLSAGTIMAIAQAVSQINVNLYTDDRRIAESSNRGTMLLASGGSN